MKDTKGSVRMIKSILIGTLIAVAMMLALCLLGGILLSKEVLPEGALSYMGWIICAITAWVGCWFAQKKAGSARLPVSLGCGGVLLLVMLAISTIGEDQEPLTWYSAAIVGGCAVMAALLGAGKKNRRR